MNRRNALARILAGGASILLLDRTLLHASPMSELRISLSDPRFAALAQVNGTVEIGNSIAPGIEAVLPSGFPLALVRVDATTIVASSMECPHNQCKVGTYNGTQFVCPCHASRFTGAGARVSGPTPRGLTTYPVAIVGSTAIITGIPGSLTWNLTDASDPQVASSFTLEQNEPNPLSTHTRIRFSLAEAAAVTLVVHDATGRRITTLADSRYTQGTHAVDYRAGALAPGVYFYTLTAGSFIETKRMIVE